MKRAARRTPSSETPCSKPSRSRRYTRSSVARLPAAPGAYGQPPVPPLAASKQRMPASSPATTLARAVPRVSWKWNARPVRGMPASTARPAISPTWLGTPTPIVSPKQTSSTPSSQSRSPTSTARSGRTDPVYGQPNAVETYPRRHQPSPAARSRTGRNAARLSATVRPMFRSVNASVAAVKTAIASAPARSARSRPRKFGTRTGYRTPGGRSSRGRSSSASASWGIARGETKLVASISRSPASRRSRM